MRQEFRLTLLWICALTLLAGCAGGPADPQSAATAESVKQPAHATQPSFILGADISWIPEDEARGATYFDQGARKDIVEILRDHGFNYVRLRVFVNPQAPGGYAARMNQAFNDTAHTAAMAKRVKAAGMGFLLDIMYADTWADPEHQPKPAAWRELTGDALVKQVGDYTREVLTALKENGTPPDMIQIGNEVTHGMLWPDGRVWSQIPSGNAQTDAATRALGPGIGNYDMFAALLKAGISAAHKTDPSAKIILHNHLARNTPRVVEWMDNLLQRGVKFDVIGYSAYAQGKDGDWQATFAAVAKRYPDYQQLVLEYSAQKRYINDLVYAIPEEKGLGTFIWEPTRHREALFNQNGVNAGGGQASNFVNDVGINQGAATRPAGNTTPTTAAATQAATRPGAFALTTADDSMPTS